MTSTNVRGSARDSVLMGLYKEVLGTHLDIYVGAAVSFFRSLTISSQIYYFEVAGCISISGFSYVFGRLFIGFCFTLTS